MNKHFSWLISVALGLLIFIGCKTHEYISMAKYHSNGKFGLVNNKGDTITESIFKSFYNFSSYECICCLEESNKCGLIKSNGKILIPFTYEYLESPNKQGIMIAKNYGKYGVINKKIN